MFRALALRWTNWVGCGLENEGWADGGGGGDVKGRSF